MEFLIDNLIIPGFKVTRLPATIGGRPAVMAKLTNDSGALLDYDAAYSPDGIGIQGSIMVYLGSSYPESTTNTFLSKLKISRA